MFNTSLFDEKTFYKQFTKDLLNAKNEVIIESSFIASERINKLHTTIRKLVNRKIKMYVITRIPEKHIGVMRTQAEEAIQYFEQTENYCSW